MSTYGQARHRWLRVAKGRHRKEHLARALGAVVAHAGLKVKIADLDPEQETVLFWEKLRQENRGEPPISVEGFDTAAEAIESAEEDELLLIDAPAHATRGTLAIAQSAALVVQPTGASIDDLRPAILLFHELVQSGVPKERLVMALCRILSQAEEDRARAYIEAAGYDALPGCIPERTAYREAHARGQAVTEAKALSERMDMLMEGLYVRVAEQLDARGKQTRRVRKRKEAS